MAIGLFDQLTEQEVLKVLEAQKNRGWDRKDEDWKLAEQFLENDQLERTRQELRIRYPTRQAMTKGEQIQPVALPLVDRFVSESANAYNRPVVRELVNESGEKDESATEALNVMVDEINLNERLHAAERFVVTQDSQPVMVQAKRGMLDVVTVPLHQTFPVMLPDARRSNRADQNDYLGHVVCLDQIDKDEKQWVFMTPAAHYYYKSDQWDKPVNIEIRPNDGYSWPQREMTDDDKEKVTELPLQMITWWHKQLPVNKLIPLTDVPIATANLELNVQMSCLLDTIRKQGWSQMVMKLLDPANPPNSVATGTGFAMALGLEEEIVSVGAGNDYTGMVGFFQFFVKILAILMRQSPNTFSIDATGPESGFAKIVDSLPKLEAREERITRLTAVEQKILWPRIGAVGKYLGKLPGNVDKLRMKVTFSDVSFPRTIDERIKSEEYDIKQGYTTAAKVMAEREGISVSDAEMAIAENKEKSPEPENKQQQQQPSERKSIADLVAQRRGLLNKQSDGD